MRNLPKFNYKEKIGEQIKNLEKKKLWQLTTFIEFKDLASS